MRFLAIVSVLFAALCPPLANAQVDGNAFVGRWDLTLHDGPKVYASWLEISQGGDQLQGRMVGRWGHVHAVLNLGVQGGLLRFESPKNDESLPVNMMFEGRLSGDTLKGTISGPPGGPWTWTGVRAPSLSESKPPAWGKSIALFNGRDLKGWMFNKPDEASNWSVRDGVLKTSAKGSDLISVRKFRDFKLHVEFNCEAGCNSGVYLRGRYEIQIADSSGTGAPNRRSAAVYGFIAPTTDVALQAGAWQSYDITLAGRTVTVVVNGAVVIDRQEISGPTGGALDSDEGSAGPIYLQGSERAGGTAFRNIQITPAEM